MYWTISTISGHTKYREHSIKGYIWTGLQTEPLNEPSQDVLSTKGYSVLSDI